MIIDCERCIGCGQCVATCPVGAVSMETDTARIDPESCVECGSCLRVADCPVDAVVQDELPWPRILRKCFSDNQFKWPEQLRYTLSSGRGTEECKTNDRTGKFGIGEVGIMVDLGRPGLGAGLKDAETIAMALLAAGARMADNSPLTGLMADRERGTLAPEVRCQRVLSCVIEAKVDIDALEGALSALQSAARQIDTVFSLGLIVRLEGDLEKRIQPIVRRMGLSVRAGAKVNLGLGRPLCTH